MAHASRTIALVACASRKLPRAAPARDLYVSDLFVKARAYAEQRARTWFVMSALHGLVDPETVVEPYDLTLHDVPADQRRSWARRVLGQLDPHVGAGDTVVILGGARYREGLVPALRARGVHVDVPLEGMRIGEQLSFLAQAGGPTRRDAPDVGTLDGFYEVLQGIGERHAAGTLGALLARRDLPARGVYFFLDQREHRSSAPGTPRVVRVGTHALARESASTLRGRLKQHFGDRAGGGNHRASVFRLHVGAALHARFGGGPASWSTGEEVTADVREAERAWERRVSAYVRALDVIVLGIPDEPGPDTARGFVERNAIALLSSVGRSVDPPSDDWLGSSSPREAIRSGGLWNVRHVGDECDDAFLERLEVLGRATGTARLQARAVADPSARAARREARSDGRRTEHVTGAARTSERPTARTFRQALVRRLGEAQRAGQAFVDVRSGDVHRSVGGYPSPRHAMATCCYVMRAAMREGDAEVAGPPKGVGASLVIRYQLPR